MKWFKHLSGSLNNSVIFESIETFGSDAYLVFFGTLEIMADEFDIQNPGVSRISIKKLTKNLQLSRQKITRILSFFDQKAKENPTEKRAFFAEIEKTHVVINCPKLKDLCDEWTAKQISKVGSKSGATPELLPPKEEEVENNTPLPPLPQTMEYPEWLDTELWGKWKEWKRSIGQPISIFEEEVAILQLEDFKKQGMDVRAVMMQSITNKYKGFFPIRGHRVDKSEDAGVGQAMSEAAKTQKYLNEIYAD